MTEIITSQIRVQLNTGIDMINITDQINDLVKKSDFQTGSVNITVTGSTGSVTTIEYEPGVVEDLKQAINRMAPPGLDYAHEKAWHDGNGHSHVQAAIIGPSIVVPIRSGKICLGVWQQIVVINHDNRSRERNIEITIIGNT